MKPFTIHDAAEAELRAAIAHYEIQRAGLGREFRQEFESAITRIRRMPQAFAPVDDQGTRKHRLQRFPYTIYYVDLDEAIWDCRSRSSEAAPRVLGESQTLDRTSRRTTPEGNHGE